MGDPAFLIELCFVLGCLPALKLLLVVADYLASPPSRDYRGDKHW